MTSEPTSAFVWVWLPEATEPVVGGRIDQAGPIVTFTYGARYLARDGAIAIYLPELPLAAGIQEPFGGLDIAGCINDAGPDAWGRRVIESRRTGSNSDASTLALLLESGSDRIGALDFQASSSTYVPRGAPATLDELNELSLAAEALEAGRRVHPQIDAALLHGSSVGGARPKALLNDGPNRNMIAKFSSSTDVYPVVKAEAVAMDLARRCGLKVASTELTSALGKDILLVDRFDRGPEPGQRKLVVSALTILELSELAGRYATYPALADQIRARFTDPVATLRELFARIVFNVCVSNTDDHARNHAAFWNGQDLTLTPAYDICPQPRIGNQAAQAMAIGRGGQRWSQLATCAAAADAYLLDGEEAGGIVETIVDTITSDWHAAADAAALTEAERTALWGRQILNPFIFEDLTS